MFLIDEVSKLFKFKDASELQLKNILPIFLTCEVLKLVKSNDANEEQL